MGAALEIIIVPLLLVTAVVLLTVISELHVGVVLAGAVFLGILYFVVVSLLKEEHDEDADAPAPGEEAPPVGPERTADVEAAREMAASAGDADTEQRSPGP